MTTTVAAAGDPSDYDNQIKENMKSVFADAAGVDIDKVTLEITPGSVNIEVEIEVTDTTAGTSVSSALQTGVLASPAALESAMATQGVSLTVLAITPPAVVAPPIILPGTQPSPPPPPPPSPSPPPPMTPQGEGGASDDIFMLLLLAIAGGVAIACIFGVCFCVMNNKTQARPLFHPMRSPIASPRGGSINFKLRSPISSPREPIPMPRPTDFMKQQAALRQAQQQRSHVEMTSSTMARGEFDEFRPPQGGLDDGNESVLV